MLLSPSLKSELGNDTRLTIFCRGALSIVNVVSETCYNVSISGKCKSLNFVFTYDILIWLVKTVLAYAKAWHHVDASGRTLGQLAGRIATVLMGKHKPIYDPSGAYPGTVYYLSGLLTIICSIADCGDYVVVTNAKKIHVSGNKVEQKVYYHHTMYPGGLKERRFKDLIKRKPEDVSHSSSLSSLLSRLNVLV